MAVKILGECPFLRNRLIIQCFKDIFMNADDEIAVKRGIFFNNSETDPDSEDKDNSEDKSDPFSGSSDSEGSNNGTPLGEGESPDKSENESSSKESDDTAGEPDPFAGLFSGLLDSGESDNNPNTEGGEESPEDASNNDMDFFKGPQPDGDFDDDGQDDDIITGDENDNVIATGAGNDSIDGGGGNDNLDGGEGDDNLIGGLGDDVLNAGHGTDNLTGGGGSDIFNFYAAGQFIIHDFDVSSDKLNFDAEEIGIESIEELLSVIESIEDTEEGVTVNFVNDIASITLVGLQSSDLSADMVGFL